jgi:hypothetical protein
VAARGSLGTVQAPTGATLKRVQQKKAASKEAALKTGCSWEKSRADTVPACRVAGT